MSSGKLSKNQEALYAGEKIARNSSPFNMAHAISTQSVICTESLKEAFQQVVENHKSLMIKITRDTNGGLFQSSLRAVNKYDFEIIDSTKMSEAELTETIQKEIDLPFDLTLGNLVRFRIFSSYEKTNIILWVIHHLVVDGWSFWLLWEELGIAYEAICKKRRFALKKENYDYFEFSKDEEIYLNSENANLDYSHWNTRLQGYHGNNSLPIDRPRPSVQRFEGASVFCLTDEAAPKSVNKIIQAALVKNTVLSEFSVLLGVYHFLLHRLSNLNDVVVRSPASIRDHSKYYNVTGCFINQLAYRSHYDPQESFLDFLIRFQKTIRVDQKHRYYPYPLLLNHINIQHTARLSALTQVSFAFRVYTKSGQFKYDESYWGGLTIERYPVRQQNCQDELQVEIYKLDKTYHCVWNYRPYLFDSVSIEKISRFYDHILKQCGNSPNQICRNIQLLSKSERTQIISNLNQTQTEYPKNQSIPEIFEKQVNLDPNKTALLHTDVEISYGDLNRCANRLGRYLQKLGVTSGSFVGVGFERSIEGVVSILAVLKCGAVYVPLNSDYPVSRLQMMIKDCAVDVLITSRDKSSKFEIEDLKIVCWEDVECICNKLSSSDLRSNSRNETALVVYSSGSTGIPKGSKITHKGLIRLAYNQRLPTIGTNDVIAYGSNSSFDAAAFEITAGLINGARVVILDKETVISPVRLGEAIDKYGITIFFLTTAIFSQINSYTPGELKLPKYFLVGGETMNPDVAKNMLQSYPNTVFIHVYGPSECSPFSSSYVIDERINSLESIPIGKPLSNTQLYILDSDMNPVPIGVTGELYIGGDGVGKGYVNRPELNSEKFVPDPFSSEPSAVLYRTGDNAKYLPDGNIDFKGRSDNQVKIRGFRIELAEIEFVLGEISSISQKAVVVQTDQSGNRYLVAFVVKNREGCSNNINSRSIRDYLKKRLPEYMIPSVFSFIDRLPLTPNQKVDRRKLESMPVRIEKSDEIESPTDEIEDRIHGVWKELLPSSAFGVTDVFTEVGGTSLLLVDLITKLEVLFRIDGLVIEDIQSDPSVRGMANYIKTRLQRNLKPVELETVEDDYGSKLKRRGKRNVAV